MTNLPAQASQTKPSNAPSQDSKTKRVQISSLVRQSFDIFNVYGKDPSAIENIILGFSSTLFDHDTGDINRAFGEWMQKSSAMPTPADILGLCDAYVSYRPSKPASGPAKPVERPQGNFRSWVYNPYPQASHDGSVAEFFMAHKPLKESEREHGYEWLRHAVDHLEYPREILKQYRDEMRLPAEQKERPEWPKSLYS